MEIHVIPHHTHTHTLKHTRAPPHDYLINTPVACKEGE